MDEVKRFFREVNVRNLVLSIAAVCAVVMVIVGVSQCAKNRSDLVEPKPAQQAQKDIDICDYFEGKAALELQTFSEEDGTDDRWSYEKKKPVYRGQKNGLYEDDGDGNGVSVFEEEDGSGANNHWFVFATTDDSGKSWKTGDGFLQINAGIDDIWVSGGRVLFTTSEGIYSNPLVFFSDDGCKSFQACCIPANLPAYNDLLRYRVRFMRILDVSKKDGSVIFGFYDTKKDYEAYFRKEYKGGSHDKTYLVVKADSKLDSFEILYADDAYIRATTSESDVITGVAYD